MDLKIKRDNRDITIPLLEEKLRGVELPYLHVKKGDKTWYAPIVKNSSADIMNDVFNVKLKYKDEKYNLLEEIECDGVKLPLNIGVITSENGFIRKSAEIKEYQENILFNKAKRLSVYGRYLDNLEKTKLIDLNYDDILLITNIPGMAMVSNYNTGQNESGYIDINNLEFREE